MVCQTEESKLHAFEENLNVGNVAISNHRNRLKEELLSAIVVCASILTFAKAAFRPKSSIKRPLKSAPRRAYLLAISNSSPQPLHRSGFDGRSVPADNSAQ